MQAEWIHHSDKDSVIPIIVYAKCFSGDWAKKLSISLSEPVFWNKTPGLYSLSFSPVL